MSYVVGLGQSSSKHTCVNLGNRSMVPGQKETERTLRTQSFRNCFEINGLFEDVC